MLHLILLPLLLINLLLLLVVYNGLIRLKVLTNPLIDSLFANFVVIAGLNFYHVFQVVYIATVKLRILRVSSCPTSSKLLMYVDASITWTFARYFEWCLVCRLNSNSSWRVLFGLSTSNY